MSNKDSAASEGVPERIFMQVDDAGPSLSLTTWCQDRINESDIEYARVRASVDEASVRRIAEKINDEIIQPFAHGRRSYYVSDIADIITTELQKEK